MTIRHLVSCRGWSSDAYWAARAATELERTGHHVALVCKRGSEARVIARAREGGVTHIDTLGFASGMKPASDLADLRRLLGWLPATDVVHVHRGKEHWLAALANRISRTPRPLFRTRHIVQPVRPHALNRWLYANATELVVTVTEAIRRQYVVAGLLPAERVVALPGGVDAQRFHPDGDGGGFHASLGLPPGVPIVGFVSGFRVMKGHTVVVQAAAALARAGVRFHLVFVGRGATEGTVREAVERAGVGHCTSIVGFVSDPAQALAAFDVALYPPLESDGMSRVLFECLAAGKPVVASRVGVVPEALVDGETALLVPAGEPGPLADAIGKLLADRSLRARLGAAAADLCAQRFSGERVAERLSALYSAAIAQRRAT